MDYGSIYKMTFDSNKTMLGGREVYMLSSTTLLDVTYENGEQAKAVNLSGNELEQLDKVIFRDVMTGNIVSISKDLIDSNADVSASTWYTGNVGVLDQAYGSDKYYACETISGSHKGVVIINDFHGAVDLAGPYEENWDTKIEMNRELTEAISQEFGVNIVAENSLGTSQGDSVAMRALAYSDKPGICVLMGVADRAQNDYHPGITVTDNYKRAFLDEEGYENVDGKTYFIFQNPSDKDAAFVHELIDNGADVYFFNAGSGGDAHQNGWSYATNAGIYDVLAGDEEAMRELYDTYTPERFVNGRWETASYEDYSTSVLNNVTPSGVNVNYSFDFSKYLDVDDFEIKAYDSTLMNTFSPLAGMGALGLSYLNNPELQSNLHGTEIVSDLTFVSDSMNQIRTGISGTSFLSSLQGLTFRSSDGIPGCLVGYIEAYFNVVGALLNDLAQETSSVMSYAQAYADMDADLGNTAGKIAAMDADGNMTTVDPTLYHRPEATISNSVTPQAAGAIGAAGVAAAGSAAAGAVGSGASTSSEPSHGTVFNANPEENQTDVIGKTPDGQDIIVNRDAETSQADGNYSGATPMPAETPTTSNTQGNTSGINTETRKFEDGSYQIRRTNDKDGTTTELNYDKNGKLLSSVTRDKNGVVTDVSSYEGSVLNRTETANTEAAGATETVQHNEDEVRQMQTTNMANTGVAMRPETPEGTKPISYKKFTREVNGDDVTYTYYDKHGNVIGETTYDKNTGHVSSSYYDYKDENGDKVRVVYDAKTADMVKEIDARNASDIELNAVDAGSSVTNDIENGTTTYTRRKNDGTVIETVTDKYSGAQMVTTTDADGNSTVVFRDKFGRRIPQDDLINDIFGLNKEELVISGTSDQVSNDVTGQVGTDTSETVVQEQTQTVPEQTQTVPEQTQTVVEDKPVTSGSTSSGGTSGSGSRGTSGGGSTYTPQPNVVNNQEPVIETQKPIDEIKEPEVIVKPEVEEKPSTPTYTNNYGPYNYYNSTPRKEETIVPTIDKPIDNVDKEVKVPEVEPEVIDNTKQTTTTTTHKNNGNNNAGRVLGTIAGVAAAGAGIAGLAYGANKIIKEQDEEDNEEDKDEFEKDENGEISLSDEI